MTEETQPAAIKIADLQLLLRCIDLAAKRGAYEGPDLSTVGYVRDKLYTFLSAIPSATEVEETAEEKPTNVSSSTSVNSEEPTETPTPKKSKKK